MNDVTNFDMLFISCVYAIQYEDQQEASVRTLEKSLTCMNSFLPSLLDIARMAASNSSVQLGNNDGAYYLQQLRDVYDLGLVGKQDAQVVEEILKLSRHDEL
ncbi:hypothetical protein EON65_32455 [archaeon]|nr:MAG: hypothetical protein EON65_32455 [archaeon]